jgi:DNA-binding response OmpR family regulator
MSSPEDTSLPLEAGLQSRLETVVAPQRHRVLIAEDDAVSATVLGALLRRFGYDVLTARTGDEAWRLFDAEPTRLVVSDWMMPGLDGLAFCEKIRARLGIGYTYFILLTANRTTSENYTLATDAGVDDFLTKPIDREALRMRLRVAERILQYTAQIRHLKELIPMCVYCRRVRDEEDYWQQVETYIQRETGSRFSHGACPECCEKEMAAFATSPSDGSAA